MLLRYLTKKHMKEGQWKLAARLTKGHTGSVYDLIVAYGYIWSEAADGSRILWKPFVSRPLIISLAPLSNPVILFICAFFVDMGVPGPHTREGQRPLCGLCCSRSRSRRVHLGQLQSWQETTHARVEDSKRFPKKGCWEVSTIQGVTGTSNYLAIFWCGGVFKADYTFIVA